MKFGFDIDLAKSEEQDGKLYLEGVASTTDLDKQRERMSPDALACMAKAVGIPLTDSHSNELGNEIGQIVESRIDGDKLIIKAEMFSDDPLAVRLWKAVQRGTSKAGFSVGGNITSHMASANKAEKRIITGVELDHVMLTKKPANPMTFAVALTKALTDVVSEKPESSESVNQGDTMSKDTLEKAGAKFSSDTVDSLKAIHAVGSGEVKAKVRALLGDDADGVLGDNPTSDTDEVSGLPNAGSEEQPLGVVAGKTEAEQSTLTKEDAEKLKAEYLLELRKEITEEVMTAFKAGLKDLTPVLKGQKKPVKADIASDTETMFGSLLGKCIR